MGTNTIPEATDGTIIPASNHNSLRDALKQDIVPRNASGVATNNAGSLGTSSFKFSDILIEGGILRSRLAAINIQETSYSGSVITSNAGAWVTAASITITCTSRPIRIEVLPTFGAATALGHFSCSNSTGGSSYATMNARIFDGSSTIMEIKYDTETIANGDSVKVPLFINFFSNAGFSGSKTFSFQIFGTATRPISINRFFRFYAMEY